MRILIGERFLQKIFNNVLLFLKAKENVALISWVLSYYLNQYFIKTAVFNIFLRFMAVDIFFISQGIIGNKMKEFFFFLVFKGL